MYNYNTNQYAYVNNSAALDPKSPAALANAFADVLFLPHSAVSINSYNSIGYYGCGSVGGYCSPSTTAALTVLYQGTGLTPSVNAIADSFYEIIYAVNSQEQSPLGDALTKYNFPNTVNLYAISGQMTNSKSYIAPVPGQPTPAPVPTPGPTNYRPPTVNYGTTTLNAAKFGDNVTTISHLNYAGGENFYWYINPPSSVPKGTKLTYTLRFSKFDTQPWYDYLYVAETQMYMSWNTYCTGSSCADIEIASSTGITLWFNSNYWSSGNWQGFIAQLTWQIYKPRKLMLSYQS